MDVPDLHQDLLSWVQIVETAPPGQRILLAALGVVLIMRGPQVYKLAIAAPGAVLGILLVTPFLEGLSLAVELLAFFGAGAIGALLTLAVEQLAVRLAGGLLGFVLVSATIPLLGESMSIPEWAPFVGGGVGLLLFPRLFRTALAVIICLLGAAAIVLASGVEAQWHLPGILVLGGIGSWYQSGRKQA